MLNRAAAAAIAALLLTLFPPAAYAGTYEDLLDDVFPTALPRSDLTEASFRILGIENLPKGSKASIAPGSLQWSRIENRIVLPRARLVIEVPGAPGGYASIRGRSTPFRATEVGTSLAELMVPLTSGSPSEVAVHGSFGKGESTRVLRLERIDDGRDRISIDTSCSPSNLEVRRRASAPNGRSAVAMLDCRWVREASARSAVPVLDVAISWDGEGSSLRANGSSLVAVDPGIYRLRLSPGATSVVLETESGDVFDLEYRLPSEASLGFFGVGMGPYHYRLLGSGADVSSAVPLFTIYGSYQLAETAKLTAFNATAIHRHFFSDSGLYVKTDSFRFFDQRIGVFLMFGANFYGFKFDSGTRFHTGLPQGFEATIRDFLRPNRNLTAGAFVYPPIDGKSYYNVWIRYGSSRFFGEMNYLRLRDRFDDQWVRSRNVGFSIGFPIARLF